MHKAGVTMKIRIEETDGEEEIIIKSRTIENGARIAKSLNEIICKEQNEMTLYIGVSEHYVKKEDILFFETRDNKVCAHTNERMYRTDYKLFELEDIMPSYFVRISKSVIVNIKLIESVSRELTGNGSVTFKKSSKCTYFSRSYYKQFKDKIREVRFLK